MLKVPKNQARNRGMFLLGYFSTHENSTPKLKPTSFDRKVN